jgi:hypothetical protein
MDPFLLLRIRNGCVANWYTSVVSTARQASQILQELHSIQLTVGASLRARQLNQKLRMILPIDPGATLPQREVSSRTAPLSLPREFLRSYLAWGCS